MKQGLFTITENAPLTDSILRMRLRGDTSAVTRPGQFVNIALAGRFLRRPLSVCDREGDELTILYKVVGGGTAQMRAMVPGERLDLLTGLGNGFDVSDAGESPLVIGGGVGVAPLYWLTKELAKNGCRVTAALGYNTAAEIYYAEEFRTLGAEVLLATADGSAGVRGLVTDVLPECGWSYYYTCGPEPMLKAVFRTARGDGQLSFEQRMGCGFGACMGCSCRTVTGGKRICREGPILRKGEILWED